MKRSVLFVSLVALGFSTPALATVIVRDSYTAADNTSLTSHAPDVNLPGGSYVNQNSPFRIGGDTNGGTTSSVSGVAVVGQDGAWGISLASAGGYVKPTDFTVSADLNLNGMTSSLSGDPLTVGAVGITRGITLGFFDNTLAINSALRRSPDGITYSPSGQLLLVEPNASGIKVDAATSAIFPTSGTHTLAYEVNTISGNISNVTFDGSPVTFTSGTTATPTFTDLATSYVGNYAAGGGNNVYGTLDNLTITAVPEPGSLLLFGLGAIGLFLAAQAAVLNARVFV